MGQREGHCPQRLTHVIPGLLGLYIAGGLVLLVRIPFGIPQEGKLAGQVADALEVGVGQPQDGIRLHERHSGEDVVGDVTAAVNDHIGSDLPQAVDELPRLHLVVRRVGVLILSLEHPQHGEVTQAFVGDQVVLDQILRHMGGGQHAPEGTLALQICRRADTGKHWGCHVAEKEDHIPALVGQILGQPHGHGGLAAAGAAPHRQHPAALILLLTGVLLATSSGKNTRFLEVQHQATSSVFAGASVSAVSLESAAGSDSAGFSCGFSSGSGSGGYNSRMISS